MVSRLMLYTSLFVEEGLIFSTLFVLGAFLLGRVGIYCGALRQCLVHFELIYNDLLFKTLYY